MDIMEKLTILADSAKYDVACTSSGVDRAGDKSGLGSTVAAGICHAFSADGRCVSLLKVPVRLRLLREPAIERCASRGVHSARAGGADHRLLPPKLY